MLGYAMTGDDWTKVLLALIAMAGTLGGLWLKYKLDRGEKLVNGRMDQMRRDQYAQGFNDGHASGVAKVSKAMADSPRVSLDAQAVAQAVADTVQPPPKK